MAVNYEIYFESVIKNLGQTSDLQFYLQAGDKPLNYLSFYLRSFLNHN